MINRSGSKCNCVSAATGLYPNVLEFFTRQSCSVVNVQSRHQSRVPINYLEALHSSATHLERHYFKLSFANILRERLVFAAVYWLFVCLCVYVCVCVCVCVSVCVSLCVYVCYDQYLRRVDRVFQTHYFWMNFLLCGPSRLSLTPSLNPHKQSTTSLI